MLVEFAEAAVRSGREPELADVRARLLDTLGGAALVDAAAVVSIYQGLDRVADATGIPIDTERLEPTADIRDQLGINEFPSTTMK